MSKTKLFQTILLLLFSITVFSQESISFPEAKFKTGDNLEWKNQNFDDSNWETLKTNIIFENQGHDKYDGFVWYRIKFFLPSSLKNNSVWKEGLSFVLNKIDDADETFLNGALIGKTGGFPEDEGGSSTAWQSVRTYNVLETKNLYKWDTENVLAIRVSDLGGGGGMFGTIPKVQMLSLDDFIEIQFENNEIKGTKNTYSTTIKNSLPKDISGTITIKVTESETGKIIKTINKAVVIKAADKISETIAFNNDGKRLEASATFKEEKNGTQKSLSMLMPYILTPKPSEKPRINSPKVFGVRPNSPILFKVAATGKSKLTYSATGLPNGITLNSTTGIISGEISTKGEYKIKFSVANVLGKASQNFILKVGDDIALTPPMGWNSWNCWGISVNDEKVRSSAQAFIDKGLVNHGWNYINIDDGWEIANRLKDGSITSNEKFPDMKKLSDWLHDKGMKFGIYSSPGAKTCGTYLGSYQHEESDATTYANWGVDYLKYDWCSYDAVFEQEHDTTLFAYQKPYKIMQTALLKQNRDIVYSLCQYGRKQVWKWGATVSGNSWRTTDDISDTWESILNTGFTQAKLAPYSRPGHWNDPDMLVVGQVGWSGKLRPSRLNPDEQYAHISLWCLLNAPLLLGCDISKLDDFTLNLITNDEVIAINQDALGKQAVQKLKTKDIEIWVKELEDGSKAIGIFNLGETKNKVNINFSDIGLTSNYLIRDLWRQKNIGVFKENFETSVYPHGVTLIRLIKK